MDEAAPAALALSPLPGQPSPALNGDAPPVGDARPAVRRLRLREMREQAVEALGMQPGMELETDDGEVVVVPNPMLSPDEVQDLLADNKVRDAARLILGAAEHDRLLAHGGHSNDVLLAWRLMQEDLIADTKSG